MLDIEELDGDPQLFSTGILDSASLLEVVNFVESTYGIRVKANELTLQNFDHVSSMLSFIEKKRESSPVKN